VPRPALRMDGLAVRALPAPRAGQHSDEILSRL
jgi:hypothetical protein